MFWNKVHSVSVGFKTVLGDSQHSCANRYGSGFSSRGFYREFRVPLGAE